ADPCLWKRWQGVGCTGIAGRGELGMHVHQHLLFDGSSDCERRGAVHDALKPAQIVWPIMSEQQLGSVGCKGRPGRMLRLTRVLTVKIAHPIHKVHRALTKWLQLPLPHNKSGNPIPANHYWLAA